MKKKQIIGIVVAAVMFIITCAASMLTNGLMDRIFGSVSSEILTGGVEFSAPLEDYIAIVSVTGTIQEQTETGLFDVAEGYQHTTTMEYINELRLTIVDDQYKSWRTYFEECAKTAIYNSEGHDESFYSSGEELTAIDTSNVVVAMYKNITFRCQLYIMTPQFSTIHKYDLLLVMKDFSEEHTGSIDGGASDLTVSFSIVGEKPSGDATNHLGNDRAYGSLSESTSSGSLLGNVVGSIVEHGVNTVIGLIK